MTAEFVRDRLTIVDDYLKDGDYITLFYCEVYTDVDQDEQIDYFCVHPSDLPLTKPLSEYTDEEVFDMAEKFATDMAKTILEDYYHKEVEDSNEEVTVYLSVTGHKKDIQDLLDYANKLPLVIRKE